jgi:farnesyl diphosphate synthase
MNLSHEQLEQMHQLKTGALLGASVLLGALCGPEINAIERAALHRYSNAIGLAFQVVDDILDVISSSAALGKTAGKDAANNKPTYVSILGLEASKVLAEHCRMEAHNALKVFPNAQTLRLSQLADFIVQRSE